MPYLSVVAISFCYLFPLALLAQNSPAEAVTYDKRNKQYVYDDGKGRTLTFDRAHYQYGERAWYVERNEQQGLFYPGDSARLLLFQEVLFLDEPYARVKTSTGYGVVDVRDGITVVRPLCQSVDRYDTTGFTIELNGKWLDRQAGEVTTLEGPPEVYRHPHTMPMLRGCEDTSSLGMQRCILERVYQNIRYPASARNQRVGGTVIHSLVIGEDGRVEELRLVQSADQALDEEAYRVIDRYLNDFEPGRQYGQAVRTYLELPINFRVE
ncbi:energy transducer TonB [Neolewinella sp.]|uniref:energy transducer TonB n=1 Tax=Neolewinella sp. TaxID=2993543 RepID=UPI003B52B716